MTEEETRQEIDRIHFWMGVCLGVIYACAIVGALARLAAA